MDQEYLVQFLALTAPVRQQRLQRLSQKLQTAQYFRQLVDQPAWPHLVDKVKEEKQRVSELLVTMQVKPERMEIVAERLKSRLDFISEIANEAKQADELAERLELLQKAHNDAPV